MGYHDGSDIPNYWAYAHNFVLDDHMFQSDASWSLPSHLYMVSGWSARCCNSDPMSCVNNDQGPGLPPDFQRSLGISSPTTPEYAWTDLTYLLHRAGVSWGYYVFTGTEPDCEQRLPAVLRAGPAAPRHPGDLEPAALLHRRPAGRPARQHPAAVELLRRCQGRQRSPPSHGSIPTARCPSIRPV